MNIAKRPPVLAGFLEDLNRIYNEILNHFDFRSFYEKALWKEKMYPEIDVMENSEGFTVSCTLPYLMSKDVDVSVAGNVLSIKGGKKEEYIIEEDGGRRKASRYHAFYRSLSLPPGVEVLQSWAELKNGVLTIVLPRKKTADVRQFSLQRL
jgi:HSP20 family protein